MSDAVKNEVLKLMDLPGQLLFTSNGEWFHDDVLVSHKGVSRFLSKNLRFDSALGSFVLAVGQMAVRVVVEDTPRVIVAVETREEPWKLILSDGNDLDFAAQHLRVKELNKFYSLLITPEKLQPERIRFSRSAAQSIFPYIDEISPGEFYFVRKNERVKIMLEGVEC